MLPILAPILTNLAANGLDLIAGAIKAKGQQVVEDTLGVKIESALASEDGKLKLAQLQADNEQALRDFVIAQKEQELRESEMAYEDTDSARKMQMAALAQGDVFSKRFIYWFAAIWSVMACIYIGFITFGEIPEKNIRFADTILGFILGTVIATILQFFFGTSQGSRNKDETLAAAIKGVSR